MFTIIWFWYFYLFAIDLHFVSQFIKFQLMKLHIQSHIEFKGEPGKHIGFSALTDQRERVAQAL